MLCSLHADFLMWKHTSRVQALSEIPNILHYITDETIRHHCDNISPKTNVSDGLSFNQLISKLALQKMNFELTKCHGKCQITVKSSIVLPWGIHGACSLSETFRTQRTTDITYLTVHTVLRLLSASIQQDNFTGLNPRHASLSPSVHCGNSCPSQFYLLKHDYDSEKNW